MNQTSHPIVELIKMTFSTPTKAARYLITLDLGRQVLWPALVLVVALSVLTLAFSQALLPVSLPEGAQGVSPFVYAAILGISILGMTLALHFVGQWMGGTGQFDEALLLMIWLQVMAIVVQVVQTGAIFILPVLGSIISLVGAIWLFCCMLQFVNELHAFKSIGRAVGAVLLSVVVIIFAATIVMMLLGVNAPTGVS